MQLVMLSITEQYFFALSEPWNTTEHHFAKENMLSQFFKIASNLCTVHGESDDKY